eukprot:1160062-Pelagomonas_calceolata.AAC.10
MYPECPGGHLLQAGRGLFGGALQARWLRGVLTIGNGVLLILNEIQAYQRSVGMGCWEGHAYTHETHTMMFHN